MTSPFARLRLKLPEGVGLSEGAWERRHRGIVVVLWGHALFIPVYAVIRGFSIEHTLIEAAIVPSLAVLATSGRLRRRVRTLLAAAGLLSASAVLVHLSGGLIEMHFHFFVMVAIVALYQDWIPFLAAFAYVLIHHGVMGSLDPASVYNHPSAIAHPWTWAGIHALFIAGISGAQLVYWRLNETYLAERKKAERKASREAKNVATLNEIGMSLTADLELSHVVQRVADIASEITSAQFGAFFYNVEDAAGGSHMLYTLSGAPHEAFANFPIPRDSLILGPTFSGGGVVRLDDVTKDPRYGKNAPHYGLPQGHLPVRSYLAAPVVSRGKVLGALFFGHEQPARFTAEDEGLVRGIASHAAAAIEGAMLFESERRARHRVAILGEASRLLGKSLDLHRILAEFATLVVPAIADSFVADIVEADGSLRRVSILADERFIAKPPQMHEVPPDINNMANPIVRSIHSRESALIEDVPALVAAPSIDPAYRELLTRIASASAVVVPLLAKEHVVGAFMIGTVHSSGRRLGPDDLRLAEDLAMRAAVAVENTALYAEQRTAAETLQQALLPGELPDLPGFSTTARYVPGGPGTRVGGDWYDAVTLRDGSVAVAMGDVVGHGIAAASLMGQLKNAMRAYSFDGYEPAEILDRLNGMLHEFGPGDLMATLAYGRFDPSAGVLKLASAGHPPPLVLAPDGTAQFLQGASGIPLGALPRARYTEAVTAVAPGSTIILYTDGLVEDRNLPFDEGMERLRAAAESASESELDPLCEALLGCAPTGSGVRDDVAILALRWHALHDEIRLHLSARPSVLRPLRATLRRWLQEAGASEQETFEILTATGEAVTNVIRHAARAGAGMFELEATRGEGISVLVRDQGQWRNRVDSRPGGQGLGIMTQFMDSVDFDRDSAGTVVTMRRRLGEPHTTR